MSWFTRPQTEEEVNPAPVQLASPEFVSALVEIAEIYEAREKAARARIVPLAEQMSRKDSFNYEELEEQYIGELRRALLDALRWCNLVSEIRERINDYEYRGRRPPYMPSLPQSVKLDDSYGE